jgi:hypothetical protein
MALRTMGTFSTTILQGFIVGTNDLIPADVASLSNSLLNDQLSATAPFSARSLLADYNQTGLLSVPNRGLLKCLPGDFIGFDATTGWPILVSAAAAATGAIWVHS